MKESVSGCPVEDAIRLLGGRWRIVLIYHLLEGKRRFSELRRAMPGISQRMLTLDLRALEKAGLVQRTIYPEIPPRVEYDLTAEGKTAARAGRLAGRSRRTAGECRAMRAGAEGRRIALRLLLTAAPAVPSRGGC